MKEEQGGREYRLLSEGGAYFWNKAPPLKHGLKIKTGEMVDYEQVYDDLTQAQKSISLFMKSECITETEKEALKKSLELVEEAKENCRLVQEEHINSLIAQSMN